MNCSSTGAKKPVEADAERSLLSVLRDDLGLTGASTAAARAECGACTVLLDGKPVRSCITRVGTAAGKQIRTIEGLAPATSCTRSSRRSSTCGALQCGYCTPGMIMSAVGLLRRQPGRRPARRSSPGMNGNICRCGTYPRIVAGRRDRPPRR